MNPSPNFSSAGRKALAAAVLVGISAPLSVSTAMAATEPTQITEKDSITEQQPGRELSTVEPSLAGQGDIAEEQASEPNPTVSENISDDLEAKDLKGTYSEPLPASASTHDKAQEGSAFAEADKSENPEAAAPQTSKSEQVKSDNDLAEAREVKAEESSQLSTTSLQAHEDVNEKHQDSSTQDDAGQGDGSDLEDAGQGDGSDLEDAGQGGGSDLEDAGQGGGSDLEDAGQGGGSDLEDAGQGREDDLNSEDDDEATDDKPSQEEPEQSPKFSPRGPEVKIDKAAAGVDYAIQVGETKKAYTTDQDGYASANLVEDFELSPGSHQVVLIGPGGDEQELTLYATEMHAVDTQVDIVGLDPSATYQLALEGIISHVGSLDFSPKPDGTFTADIYSEFPHAWPGRHVVTLTGAGYNQSAYVHIPVVPSNPNPSPDPGSGVEPAPNPSPDPGSGVEPAPNPSPDPGSGVEPAPNPSPDPGSGVEPAPNQGPGIEPNSDLVVGPSTDPETPQHSSEVITQGLGPQSTPSDTRRSEANTEEEADRSRPAEIEILDTLQIAEAVEANRRPSHEADELPVATGDHARHAAPEVPGGVQSGQGIEAAPQPHTPVPLEQDQSEVTHAPRNSPAESEKQAANPTEDMHTAQYPSTMDTERTAMSGWTLTALLGAALAVLAALSIIVFGRNRKTD